MQRSFTEPFNRIGANNENQFKDASLDYKYTGIRIRYFAVFIRGHHNSFKISGKYSAVIFSEKGIGKLIVTLDYVQTKSERND